MHRICTDEKIIHIEGHAVRLQKKNMKSLRLRLIPPHGEIRLSVPSWYSDRKAAQFVAARLDWIEEQKKTILAVHPLNRQSYNDGDLILFRGEPVRIRIEPSSRNQAPGLTGDILLMKEREGSEERRQTRIENWYREQMKALGDPLIIRWAAAMGVEPGEWRIRKMNTRWGTCNVKTRRIWLNLELITMKPAIMEYVVVHELAHLIERSHNRNFRAVLDRYLPGWRELSRELKGGLPF